MVVRDRLPPFPSHIKVTTITDFPYSEIINVNGTLVGRGICFEFFNALARKYNFTYTIVPPANDVIGNESTGMISQIYKKEVDMAVSYIPIIDELAKFVEFGEVIDEMDTTFLMSRPGTSATGTGIFAPFSERVWWAIVFSILFIGPVVYILIFLRSRFADTEGAEKFTFLSSLWWAYASAVKQGTYNAPTGDSIRLAFSGWWIFLILLGAYYTANLTAFYTRNKFTLWFNSMEDLGYWRYYSMVIEGRSADTLLKYRDVSVNPILKLEDWRYIYRATDYNMSYTNILKLASKRMFIIDRTLAKLAIQEDYHNRTLENVPHNYRCRFSISDHNVLPKMRSYAFQKNSILRKYFQYDMMTVMETGLMQHYREHRTFVFPSCPLDITMIERQMKPTDLYVMYWVAYHCYFVAGGIWGLEVFLWLTIKLFKWCFSLRKVGEIKGTNAPQTVEDDKPITTTKEAWSTRTPPPSYESAEAAAAAAGRKTFAINGREYDVVHEERGDQRLMPTRRPSSHLFQYIH